MAHPKFSKFISTVTLSDTQRVSVVTCSSSKLRERGVNRKINPSKHSMWVPVVSQHMHDPSLMTSPLRGLACCFNYCELRIILLNARSLSVCSRLSMFLVSARCIIKFSGSSSFV